ncbi:hypothetical protein Bca4012_050202 [Brassica carinata]
MTDPPPGPPDPTSPLSPHLFPPLSPASTNSALSTVPFTSRKGSRKPAQTAAAPSVPVDTLALTPNLAITTPICDGSTAPISGSGKTIVPIFGSFKNPEEEFTTTSKNSPIQTNKASSQPSISHQTPPPLSTSTPTIPPPSNPSAPPLTLPATMNKQNINTPPSLVKRIRRSEDKTLSRLAHRENGEVVEVTVHYPWVPPTCYHCHELGHIIRNCLLYTPPAADPPAAAGKRSNKTPAKSAKKAHPTIKVSQSTSTTSGPSKPSNQAQKAPDSVPRSSPKEGVSTNDCHCLATPSIDQIVAAYHMDISTSSISTKHPPSLVDHRCLLCNSSPESRDYIFGECNFYRQLWSLAARRIPIAPSSSWLQTLDQMTSLPPLNSSRLLRLLVWQSTLYWTWNERNSRVHANAFRSVDSLFL